MAIRYDMAVGLHKGHKVTKNQLKPKPARRKGVCISGNDLSIFSSGQILTNFSFLRSELVFGIFNNDILTREYCLMHGNFGKFKISTTCLSYATFGQNSVCGVVSNYSKGDFLKFVSTGAEASVIQQSKVLHVLRYIITHNKGQSCLKCSVMVYKKFRAPH